MQRMYVFLKRSSYVGNDNNGNSFCVGSNFKFRSRIKEIK